MVNYMADDVKEIANRIKQIAKDEARIQEENLDQAMGHDLELIARKYDIWRKDGENDYQLTVRVKEKIKTIDAKLEKGAEQCPF